MPWRTYRLRQRVYLEQTEADRRKKRRKARTNQLTVSYNGFIQKRPGGTVQRSRGMSMRPVAMDSERGAAILQLRCHWCVILLGAPAELERGCIGGDA